MTWALHRTSAITGIGASEYSRASGRSVLSLAATACQQAVADAGIGYDRVDGILTYGLNDTVHPHALATALGLPRLGYYANYFGGGNMCVSTVATAAMAIHAGMAENVLVFRAMNGRSSHRLGQVNASGVMRAADEAQYTMPVGWLSYAQYIAMAARRHMIKYGTTSEDFGRVAVTFRANAAKNERAMMRTPITLEDHQNSRWIADPLRLFDVCLESDGACALLVSGAAEARDLKQQPVYLLGAALGGGRRPGYAFDGFFTTEDLADVYAGAIAPGLWESAGLGPDAIDVASIYDCFTFSVLAQLEGFGFCRPGEAAAFVADGGIGLHSVLPVNPHGGLLSEAYIHGLNGVFEMVSQLRGQAGGRQVADPAVGLATGFGVTTGCAVVLGV